jgi:hypothetical protein
MWKLFDANGTWMQTNRIQDLYALQYVIERESGLTTSNNYQFAIIEFLAVNQDFGEVIDDGHSFGWVKVENPSEIEFSAKVFFGVIPFELLRRR